MLLLKHIQSIQEKAIEYNTTFSMQEGNTYSAVALSLILYTYSLIMHIF